MDYTERKYIAAETTRTSRGADCCTGSKDKKEN
jgi:hypothetical protein